MTAHGADMATAVAAPVAPAAAPALGDTAVRSSLRSLAQQRFARSQEVATAFFDAHADDVARACEAMAQRFARGGRLLAFGGGASASDARHVAVEFVHPVLVGKRALPAIALPVGARSGDAARALAVLGRPVDIAMGIAAGALDTGITVPLADARRWGMLTLLLAGGAAAVQSPPRAAGTGAADLACADLACADLACADHTFVVPSPDPLAVQEVHEMTYHVLWELVHVFLDPRLAS